MSDYSGVLYDIRDQLAAMNANLSAVLDNQRLILDELQAANQGDKE